jgi:preprotein translocase subunit SecA
MEAKILSNQIEGAQKKVEEQNFVARKNVLKYDDVMNTQRMVIYEQRRRVLEGEDLSADVHEWIRETVARTVDQFLEGDYSEEWDLASLVQAMNTLYGSDITEEELRDEVGLDRDSLVDEFVDDALDEYRQREARFGADDTGTPIMRELERFIILQIVDTRWREHLENMDYMREGIHLRSFAQKDPLVEYRSEGHAMFEELGVGIREEVVFTLFHAEIEPQDAAALEQNQQQQNGNLQYAHETATGADAIAAAGGGSAGSVAGAGALGLGGSTSTMSPQTVVASEQDKIGRNDPCWCGSGKKFKKCHGA